MQDERCTWQDDLATLTDAKFATEPHGSLSICTKQPYENLLHKPISGDNLALKLGSDGLRVRWRCHNSYCFETGLDSNEKSSQYSPPFSTATG